MGLVNSRDDTERYRLGYPDLTDDPKLKMNVQFYKNEINSKPDDTIHTKWFGNYGLLERHHAYIQWIFPIREEGVNHLAQVLQLHEAEAIRTDKKCLTRVQRSYEMMLDFYGIKLVDQETGQLERAENYKSRFNHLNSSFHNYLRVTRILKSLGELGFEHYKLPFIKFMLIEIFDTQLLVNCKESCVRFWAQSLRNDKERAEAESIIKQYLGVNDLSDEEQDIDDDIADKWLGGDSDDDEEQQNEDDKDEESANKSNEHDEEQDIDDDIADKWLGGDSDDDDEQDEDREIQQALEDLISADDDDELVAPGEVIGVKESVEIRIANDAEQSVETKNESQTSILEL